MFGGDQATIMAACTLAFPALRQCDVMWNGSEFPEVLHLEAVALHHPTDAGGLAALARCPCLQRLEIVQSTTSNGGAPFPLTNLLCRGSSLPQLELLRLQLDLNDYTAFDFSCMFGLLPHAFPGLTSLELDLGCNPPEGLQLRVSDFAPLARLAQLGVLCIYRMPWDIDDGMVVDTFVEPCKHLKILRLSFSPGFGSGITAESLSLVAQPRQVAFKVLPPGGCDLQPLVVV